MNKQKILDKLSSIEGHDMFKDEILSSLDFSVQFIEFDPEYYEILLNKINKKLDQLIEKDMLKEINSRPLEVIETETPSIEKLVTPDRLSPGFYTDISDEQYFSDKNINRSDLVLLLEESKQAFLQRDSRPPLDSPSIKFGSYFDSLMTTTTTLDRYTAKFEGDKRTKQGKIDYAEWLEKNGKKEIVTEKNIKLAGDMMMGIYNNPETAGFFKENDKFDILYQTVAVAEYRGIMIKVRPDIVIVHDGIHYLVDLKTTADLKDVSKSVLKYRYYFQQWLYTYVYAVARNIPVENIEFSFVFSEKAYPNMARHHYLDTDWKKLFERDMDDIVKKYNELDHVSDYDYLKRTVIRVPEWV